MCLALPAKIIQINEEEFRAKVEYMGTRCWVGISLVPGIEVGSFVLIHAGEAINEIDEKEAKKTLEVWEEFYAARGEHTKQTEGD